MQGDGGDVPFAQQDFCKGYTSIKCSGNFIAVQAADAAGDRPFAKVAVGLKVDGRNARHGGVGLQNGFQFQNYGYAAAVAYMMLLILTPPVPKSIRGLFVII